MTRACDRYCECGHTLKQHHDYAVWSDTGCTVDDIDGAGFRHPCWCVRFEPVDDDEAKEDDQ